MGQYRRVDTTATAVDLIWLSADRAGTGWRLHGPPSEPTAMWIADRFDTFAIDS